MAKRDEVIQSLNVVSNFVMPVYNVLPLTQYATNPPPQPIPGLEGAIAYQLAAKMMITMYQLRNTTLSPLFTDLPIIQNATLSVL